MAEQGLVAARAPPAHIAPLLDLEALRRDGYLVLPEVVPPQDLPALREHCELMYRRHHDEGTCSRSLKASSSTDSQEAAASLGQRCLRQDADAALGAAARTVRTRNHA